MVFLGFFNACCERYCLDECDSSYTRYGAHCSVFASPLSVPSSAAWPRLPLYAGIQGVLQTYQACLPQIKLYGPTNFSPVIEHVARFAKAAADDAADAKVTTAHASAPSKSQTPLDSRSWSEWRSICRFSDTSSHIDRLLIGQVQDLQMKYTIRCK